MKRLFLALMLAGAALATEAPTRPPCENFPWDTARERAAFAATPANTELSGAIVSEVPSGATRLELLPYDINALPAAPGRAPKDATTAKGGWFGIEQPVKAGLYQITLDGKLWVDAVQDGKVLASVAHGSDSGCSVFHKSVRFELDAVPVSLQFTGEGADTVVFTILPARD